MLWLSKHYEIIPLSELCNNYLLKGKNVPKDAVALTFDDGYFDNYERAFPLLRDLGLPATIFCTTKFLDGYWPEHDWGGIEKKMLNGPAISKMCKFGITFESHGHSHNPLTKLNSEEIDEELSASKNTLYQLTGREPLYLSYPFGSYDATVVERVKQCGFSAAFTVWSEDRDRFAINRLPIHRRDGTWRLWLKLKCYDRLKPFASLFERFRWQRG